jgi:hypothetical protein
MDAPVFHAPCLPAAVVVLPASASSSEIQCELPAAAPPHRQDAFVADFRSWEAMGRPFGADYALRRPGRAVLQSHLAKRGDDSTLSGEARCTPGGPESGKKIQIWKIFCEIRSRGAPISRFGIVGVRVGVVEWRLGNCQWSVHSGPLTVVSTPLEWMAADNELLTTKY